MRASIADLWQGQSLQPPWKRFPGQLEEVINFALDPLEGGRKRNCTTLGIDISTTLMDPANNWYHATLRGFTIWIRDGQIVVLDEDYNEMDVTDLTAGNFDGYLDGTNANLLDTTVGIDTLIIVNKTMTVEMEATPDYEVLGEVNQFSDLSISPEDPADPDPTEAAVGDHWRVIIDENLDPAGHYVKTADGWERVAAPNDPDGRPDTSTWPHRLVYRPDTDDFVFDALPLEDRLSGNSVTSPVFPIVGSTILTARFFSGRLVFIGRDSVNTTAAQNIFRVFVNNVKDIADDDPISLDITQSNVGLPLRTEVCGEALLIDCENGQLTFSSSDQALSTRSARIRQISNYKSLGVYPGTSNSRVVIADQAKQLRVFTWNPSTQSVEYVGSTTEHVAGIFEDFTIVGIFLYNDATFVTTNTNTVWVHEAYYGPSQIGQAAGQTLSLLQSAWSRYTFNESIRYIDSWADVIRLVSLGETWTIMEYQHQRPVSPTGFDFDPRLDRRVLVTGVYNPVDDETEFRLSNRDASVDNTWVVTTKTPSGEDSHEFHKPVRVSRRRLWISGKWTGYQHYVGWGFTARMTLTKFYAGASDIRPMMSGFAVFHVNTTNYTIEVGREGQTLREIDWPSQYLDAMTLDESMVQTGHSSNLLVGDARTTTIKIENDTPGTCTISAFELKASTKGRG